MTGPEEACRILVVHRYYWPDTPPYATLLRRIAWQWGRDGHEVHVVAGQPSYKAALQNSRSPREEQVDLATVRRLTLPNEAGRIARRVFNGLKLSLFVSWRLLAGRYDVVMISTVPPVLGAFVVSFFARLTRTRFMYHCMDIHPEIGRLSGEFRNPLLFRLLQKLDNFSCRTASPVIVLSQDMRESLVARSGGDAFEIEVLNNASLPSEDPDGVELPFEVDQAKFVLVFAGNVGRFQGLETLMQAMAIIRDRTDIELLVLGDGVEKNKLERLASDQGSNVRFVGHRPAVVAKAAMRVADAGYVGLAPGVIRYAYPSKTATYLEQGLPLIVALEPSSELAREVEDHGVGRVIPQDAGALARAITAMADNRSALAGMRVKAMAFAERSFAENRTLGRWSALIRRK